MQSIYFVASIDRNYIDKMDEIVHDLREFGFHITKVRKLTGTISGTVDSVARIKKVKILGLNIEQERANYLM